MRILTQVKLLQSGDLIGTASVESIAQRGTQTVIALGNGEAVTASGDTVLTVTRIGATEFDVAISDALELIDLLTQAINPTWRAHVDTDYMTALLNNVTETL